MCGLRYESPDRDALEAGCRAKRGVSGLKNQHSFFSLSRGFAAARPARGVRQRGSARAARSAPSRCNTFCGNLEKQVGQVHILALRRRLLLAEQDAESSADSRSWLDHAHLRIFHFT